MATRKTAPRRSSRKTSKKGGRVSFSTAFWVLFFIVLISFFFILLPKVRNSITLPSRQVVTEKPAKEEPAASPEAAASPEQRPATTTAPAGTAPVRQQPEQRPTTAPAGTAATRQQPEQRPTTTPAGTAPVRQQPEQRPTTTTPAGTAPAGTATARQQQETRDRSVYFVRDNAALTLVKSERKLAVSDSPLIDCVNALLAGPTTDERNRGLISFIPPNARLLSARVAGSTVHLNFNEEFRYNTGGREGSEAQLRQIVWTATEFPNVNNVQIEIEGKIVDFLVEGITIRNPIGR